MTPHVRLLIGRLVGRSVCHRFPERGGFKLPCSYQSTLLICHVSAAGLYSISLPGNNSNIHFLVVFLTLGQTDEKLNFDGWMYSNFYFSKRSISLTTKPCFFLHKRTCSILCSWGLLKPCFSTRLDLFYLFGIIACKIFKLFLKYSAKVIFFCMLETHTKIRL